MKVKEIKTGEVFVIDHTLVRPKLKLKQGYLDMATQYIWVCREEADAEILTGSQTMRVAINWKMTPEGFEKHKQILIKKYIEEEDR